MYSGRQHFSHCVIVSVLLSLWMDVSSGMISIQLIPQYPVIRESVTLSVTGITGRIVSFDWYKGPDPSHQYHILTYISPLIPGDDPLIPGHLYFSRVTAFPNGSLLISDLHVTDGGNYIVKIQTDTPQQQAFVNLTVYELVTKPKVTASTSQPKENYPFTLTCDTFNALKILWSRGNARLPPGTILSADNRTVTFSNVTRADSGEYRCEAENPVSKSISDPYTVTVSYGPENVQITGTLHVSVESVTSLTCSADSVPPPNYQWRFNDRDLNIKQNTLSIDRVYPENQGNYTCVVNNSVTLRTATAAVYVTVSMESAPPSPGMKVGTIVGIVVAVLLLVVLVTALVFLFIIRKRHKKPSNNMDSVKNNASRNEEATGQSYDGENYHSQANTPTTEQPELQYAAIDFNKNMPRKPQEQPELQYATINLGKNTPDKKQEQPELQYASIELNTNMARGKKQPPGNLHGNRRPQAPPPPENTVYSELKLN